MTMISNFIDFLPYFRVLIFLLLVIMCPQVAFGDRIAMDEITHLIRNNPSLDKIFSQAKINSATSLRAEAIAEDGKHIFALVVYQNKPGVDNARIGESYCHAALSKYFKKRLASDIAKKVKENQYLFDFLLRKYESQTYMREVESGIVKNNNKWDAYICRVHHDNITYSVPDKDSIDSATYNVGVELYNQGSLQEASRIFLLLQDNQDYFPNILIYLSLILEKQNSEYASLFRKKFIDIRDVSDVDALIEYIDWAEHAGDEETLKDYIARCHELGGCEDVVYIVEDESDNVPN